MPITMQTSETSFAFSPNLSLAHPSQIENTKLNHSVATLDDDFKKNVRENDDFSVDCLFTLVCSEGPLAKEAETFLFDLYTGRVPADISLQQQLEWDCLRLYEMVEKRNAMKTAQNAWELPEKILIIAGFAVNPKSQLRTNISEKINQKMPDLSAYIEVDNPISNSINASFFDSNRLITHTEVNAAGQRINAEATQFNFLDAQAIAPQEVEAHTFSSKLITQLTDMSQPHVHSNFIPLLFRDHWVLFGVSVSETGEKNSILFDSANYLTDKEKVYIQKLSEKIGAENIHFIEQNIQTHLPNCCGLLVTKAQECLSKNFYGQPNEIASDFSDNFLSVPIEEQALFNRRGRAEMYGNVIDLIRELYHSN